jgi:glycyl-tRNA synthetase beta chain
VVWAAVSLADKLDSLAGMFAAGERPTGSRDPLALRRQAQGAMKILVDLPALTGLSARLRVGALLDRAGTPFTGGDRSALSAFVTDRLSYVLEQRGHDIRAVRAVLHGGIDAVSPLEARLKLEALAQMSGSAALLGVATLFKRVKNITRGVAASTDWVSLKDRLVEPAERALLDELEQRDPVIRAAATRGDYREAFAGIAAMQPTVAKFFDDVLVMAKDEQLRDARLGLVAKMRDLILEIADISEIVTGD